MLYFQNLYKMNQCWIIVGTIKIVKLKKLFVMEFLFEINNEPIFRIKTKDEGGLKVIL